MSNQDLNNNTTTTTDKEDEKRNNSSSSSLLLSRQMSNMSASSRSSFLTEAVPLSLSSMAHLTVPSLKDGVMDGVKELIQHMWLGCVNYARQTSKGPPPTAHGNKSIPWSFRDIQPSPVERRFVGQLIEDGGGAEALYDDDEDTAAAGAASSSPPPPPLPNELTKQGFQHIYAQDCCLYLGEPPVEEPEYQSHVWQSNEQIVGRIRLWFAAKELLTEDELLPPDEDEDDYDDEDQMDDDGDDDDVPVTILYKAEVEYRSLPPTGNQDAVEVEELSMLSFGYSIDDDVKYGALAAIYDPYAKYVLEIYSVRGRKYKFDLMSSTLSDGRVPQWQHHHVASTMPAAATAIQTSSSSTLMEEADGDSKKKKQKSSREKKKNDGNNDPYLKSLCVTVTDHTPVTTAVSSAITRLSLTLDMLHPTTDVASLPSYASYTKQLQKAFLWGPVASAMAIPSRQVLLLDEQHHAGHVYIDGKYMTTWGNDPTMGVHTPALFGMNLHSIPVWHGRIVDYEMVKHAYCVIWQEVLIDAKLTALNLAGRLLWRLMYGKDDDGYDMDDEDDEDIRLKPNTNMSCLESELMSSATYDPVGICAKALATKFAQEFGLDAFPCTPVDVPVVKKYLGHRTPILVPQRCIAVLRRGGYFDWKRTMEDLWFTEHVRAPETDDEVHLVQRAVTKLQTEYGLENLMEGHVLFIRVEFDTTDPIGNGNMCRYYEQLRQYHVNDYLLNEMDDNDEEESAGDDKVFWLCYYILEQHGDRSLFHEFVHREMKRKK